MRQRIHSAPNDADVSKGRPKERVRTYPANLVRVDRATNQVTIIGRYSRREDAAADQQWFAVNETTGLYLIGE